MAQIAELIKSPEEKFLGDEEEFTAPSDAILTALSSLDDFTSGEVKDCAGVNKDKSPKKLTTNRKMDTSPEKNGDDEVKILPVPSDASPSDSGAKGAANSANDSVDDLIMTGPSIIDTDEMTDFERRLREEPIDHEINVDFDVLSPNTSGSASLRPTPVKRAKRPRMSTLEDDPRWLEAFHQGWKREIVQRGTADGSSAKNPRDTYYFTPTGKKLRSLVEIGNWLEKEQSTLTIENFTFARRTIYKEPFEVFRYASQSRGRGTGARGGRGRGASPGSAPSTPESPRSSDSPRGRGGRGRPRGRGRGRGRGDMLGSSSFHSTPGMSPLALPDDLPLGSAGVASSGVEAMPALEPRSHDKVKKHKHKEKEHHHHHHHHHKKHKHEDWPKHTTDSSPWPSKRSHEVIDLDPPSTSTPARDTPTDVVPVSLFPSMHLPSPSVPSVKKAVAKKRTAPRFSPPKPMATNGERPESGIEGSTSPPQKRQRLNSSTDSVSAETVLCGLACAGREGLAPTLHCNTCMMLFHPECVGVNGGPTSPSAFTCNICKRMTPIQYMRLFNQQQSCNKKSPKVGLSPASANITSPISTPAAATGPPVPKPSGDDVSTVDLSKIINQNQVSGQLLTLPPGVLNHLDMTQPLALKVNNKVLMIPPNCFISSDLAVKVFLPPGTLPNTLFKEKNLPINFNFYAKNNEQILNFTETNDSPMNNEKGGDDKENEGCDKLGRLSRRQVKTVNPNECHFQKLHSGYDCMINIFRYLSIADLLRAARVCRTWAKVSSQDCLWKVVKLKDSRVSDWETAARRFKNHNTWFLDLKGMLYFEDRNRTWHQFTAVMENLKQLRHISFGQCPASILHAVVEKLEKLEVLSAEAITDMLPEAQMWTTNTKVDLGKFANLKAIEQLRLRGVCGLVLPAFSFSGGLAELSSLTTLKTLVMTTLRNVPDSEFLFLGSLKNLETLEIGDCAKWNAEVYQQLGELTKLKRLRLECGGEKPEPALAEALAKLTELEKLELVKFAIDSSLEGALQKLPKLTSLVVWPDNTLEAALVNTNTLKAIKPLKALKQLDWGIMADTNSIVLRPEGPDGDGEKIECLAFLEEEEEKEKTEEEEKKKEGEEGEKKAEGEQKKKTTTEKFVSISRLLDQLGSMLPEAKIRVFKVPLSRGGAAAATPTPTPDPPTTPPV